MCRSGHWPIAIGRALDLETALYLARLRFSVKPLTRQWPNTAWVCEGNPRYRATDCTNIISVSVRAIHVTDCADTTFYTAVLVCGVGGHFLYCCCCSVGGHFLYCSCCSVWCWWPLFILQLRFILLPVYGAGGHVSYCCSVLCILL